LPRPVRIQAAAAPQASNAAEISRNIDIQLSHPMPTISIARRTHFSLEQAGHTSPKRRGLLFKNEYRRFSFVICWNLYRALRGPRRHRPVKTSKSPSGWSPSAQRRLSMGPRALLIGRVLSGPLHVDPSRLITPQGYGGPALPSPSIGQCLNGLGWLKLESHRCKAQASPPPRRPRRPSDTQKWKDSPRPPTAPGADFRSIGRLDHFAAK